MKTKFKILILTLILSVSLIPNAFADFGDTIPASDVYNSIYTPIRPGIDFSQDASGLTYPSFNNFYNNPKLTKDFGNGTTEQDERYFLLGRYCPQGVCTGELETLVGQEPPTNNDSYFYNTLQRNELKAGDEIEFMVYFHNNGKDPFETTASTYAKDVEISIDFDNILDPSDASILRPVASIYSPDNVYKTTSGSVINSKTATDDMQIKRVSPYLSLEAVDQIHLMIPKANQTTGDTENWLITDIDSNGTVPFFYFDENGDIQSYTTDITPSFSDNKVSLTFDQLPGCFRFSGFVFFRAKVVENMPVCDDLTITAVDTVLNGTPTKRYSAEAHFSDNITPPGIKFVWTTTDPDGQFVTMTNGVTHVYDMQAILDPNENVYYSGPQNGTVLVNIDSTTYDENKLQNTCEDRFTIEAPVCTNLVLETEKTTINGETAYLLKTESTFSPNTIPVGSEIVFTANDPNAKFVDQNGNDLTNIHNSTLVGYSTTTETTNSIYYIGDAEGDIMVKSPDGQTYVDCTEHFTPDLAPVCTEIQVNHNDPIEEKVVTTFTSQSLNSDGEIFDGQITYSVDEGYGFFMTEQCAILNSSSHPIDYQFGESIVKKENIFNPHLFQANTMYNLTDIQKASIINEVNIQKEVKKLMLPKITQPVITQPIIGQPIQPIFTKPTVEQPIFSKPGLDGIYTPSIPKIDAKYLCAGETTITVDAGETVYFYGEKSSDGANVVHIDTENTNVLNCQEDYPIIAKPVTPDLPICTGLTFTNVETIVNGQNGFLINANPIFTPTYYKGTDELKPVSILWETTDANGVFYTNENNTLTVHPSPYLQESTVIENAQGQRHLFADVYYVGTENITETVTVNLATYDADGIPYEICKGEFDIEPIPQELVCLNIDVYNYIDILNPQRLITIQSGETYVLNTNVEYSQIVSDGKTVYSSDSGVFIVIPKSTNVTNTQTSINIALQIADQILANGFTRSDLNTTSLPQRVEVEDGSYVILITTQDSEESNNALLIQALDRTEERCIETFPLLNSLVCIDLEVYDWTIPENPSMLSNLQAGTVYELTSNVDYSKNTTDSETTYSSDYGVFIAVPQSNSIITDNINLTTIREIALELQNRNFSSTTNTSLSNEITVQDGQTVFFITYADAATTTTGLIVTATGSTEEDCTKVYPLTQAPQNQACLDLIIVKPAGNWDNNDFTDNSEQKFEIEVQTNPSQYISELEFLWEVDPSTTGDWSKGSTTDSSDTDPFVNYLRNIDEQDEPQVTVTAIDTNTNQELPTCIARKNYEYQDQEPEINKYVYDVKAEDFRSTINIGGKATDEEGNWINQWLDPDFRYVNYLIEFIPNSARSAQIWEQYLNNAIIEGSLDGELDYLDMAILVEPNDNRNPYVIYATENFDENRYLNEQIGEERFDDYTDYNKNLSDLEDKYKCENANSDVVCIAEDFNDIEDMFKDGEAITFDNLNEAGRVYIIIQTENQTVITDDRCKELENTDGCGEVFDNTIHFEGNRRNLDSNFDIRDNEYEGTDSAQVIVICPYIITREGGDVFFKDILDTGVDVEYCSPVSSTPGTVVKPPRPPNQTTPSTGSDANVEDIVYKIPTHDICKLSNTEEGQLEEYKNVLKNFSSSICEMEADVSASWTETNITAKIKANIEKISRFGKVETFVKLISQNDLSSKGFTNLKSGVFVIEGNNLEIGNGTNDYLIKSSSEISSAQTFIVKGGDLIINSNIRYDDSQVDPLKPESFPSVAFIVIDGNIKISNNVTHIDGILMAVDSEGAEDGKIMALESLPTFENQLLVNGSMIGDVYDIFFKRRAIGDPLKDEGSITVKYDQRMLLNTPPGLSELIDLSQLKIAK